MFDALLDNNRAWAERVRGQDPDFFATLAEGQNPNVCWIGCADSRVPVNQIVDCAPGDLFVHRNVANLIVPTDANGLSVLQYAVDVLRVDHVVVCGHYRCGGVQAALQGQAEGAIGEWLNPLEDLLARHADELDAIEDKTARWDRGCELNVAAQVRNVAQTATVQKAWQRGEELAIHGWIYGLEDGRIRDLGISVAAADEVRLLDRSQSEPSR